MLALILTPWDIYLQSESLLFSLSAGRWWYKVVVIVFVIAMSCSSLLLPVTADLLGWSSAIWRYTKSYYSLGHGLGEEEKNTGWGMIKECPHSPHTDRLTRRQRDRGRQSKESDFRGGGKGKVEDVLSGVFRLLAKFGFALCWYMLTSEPLCTPQIVLARPCVNVCCVCLCACVRARMPRSVRAPRFLSAPSGPAAERERERVSHPADERVRVKALPSQKNITQLPRSLFEVIQEEGGKRHTFSIALKHGVRQLPSCCML